MIKTCKLHVIATLQRLTRSLKIRVFLAIYIIIIIIIIIYIIFGTVSTKMAHRL